MCIRDRSTASIEELRAGWDVEAEVKVNFDNNAEEEEEEEEGD